MSRVFDGTTGVNLSSAATLAAAGGIAYAGIIKHSSANTGTPTLFKTTGGGVARFNVRINSSTLFTEIGGGTDRLPSTNMPVPADTWSLAAVTKASGTVAPRFHIYDFSSDTWTRNNGTVALADPGAPDTANISISFERWIGELAVAAFFDHGLTDTQLDSMPYTLSAWLAAEPEALWVENHSTLLSFRDWTGNEHHASGFQGTVDMSTESVPTFSYGHPILLATTGGTGGGEEPSGPSYRAGSAASASGTASTVDITIPAAVQQGDLMLAVVSHKLLVGSGALNTPPGWSQVAVPVNGPSGVTFQGAVYGKMCDADDAGSTVTFDAAAGSQQINVAFAAYKNASNLFRAGNFTVGSTTASTDIDLPESSALPGDLVVLVGSVRGSTSGPAGEPTFSAPAGATIRAQSANTSGSAQNVAAFIGDHNDTTGARTVTASVASWEIAGQLVLQPVTESVTGTVAATLPSLTAAAAGTATVSGSATATLPAVTAAGDGDVSAAGVVTAALPAVQGEASGTARTSGAVAGTVPALQGQAAGTAHVAGAVPATLPALLGEAAGTARTTGAGEATLPALQAAADGAAATAGVVNATLPALSGAATGTVFDNTVTGTIDADLPALTGAATGASTTAGTAAGSLPSLSASATVAARVAGSVTATLPALVAAGEGAAQSVLSGVVAVALPPLAGDATATVRDPGAATVVLPALTGTAAGHALAVGAVEVLLPALVAASAGRVRNVVTPARGPVRVRDGNGTVRYPSAGTVVIR